MRVALRFFLDSFSFFIAGVVFLVLVFLGLFALMYWQASPKDFEVKIKLDNIYSLLVKGRVGGQAMGHQGNFWLQAPGVPDELITKKTLLGLKAGGLFRPKPHFDGVLATSESAFVLQIQTDAQMRPPENSAAIFEKVGIERWQEWKSDLADIEKLYFCIPGESDFPGRIQYFDDWSGQWSVRTPELGAGYRIAGVAGDPPVLRMIKRSSSKRGVGSYPEEIVARRQPDSHHWKFDRQVLQSLMSPPGRTVVQVLSVVGELADPGVILQKFARKGIDSEPSLELSGEKTVVERQFSLDRGTQKFEVLYDNKVRRVSLVCMGTDGKHAVVSYEADSAHELRIVRLGRWARLAGSREDFWKLHLFVKFGPEDL